MTDEELDEKAKEIGRAIEQHLGRDWLDYMTAYGVAFLVLQYLERGSISGWEDDA